MDLTHGWRSVELLDPVGTVVTMLSMEERQCLYALGRDYWMGQGDTRA